MSKHDDKTAKDNVDKDDFEQNSINKLNATDKIIEQKVIHNTFIDTLEKPITTSPSNPSTDASLPEQPLGPRLMIPIESY